MRFALDPWPMLKPPPFFFIIPVRKELCFECLLKEEPTHPNHEHLAAFLGILPTLFFWGGGGGEEEVFELDGPKLAPKLGLKENSRRGEKETLSSPSHSLSLSSDDSSGKFPAAAVVAKATSCVGVRNFREKEILPVAKKE